MKKFTAYSIFFVLCHFIGAQNINKNFPVVTGGEVRSILVDDDYIYLAGSFDYIGPYTGNNIKISVSDLTLDTQFPFIDWRLNCVISDGSGGWYVSGGFTEIGGIPRKGIARINSNGTVHPWNPQFDYIGGINKMIIHNGYLYVSGYFKKGEISVLGRFNLSTGALDESWNTGLLSSNHDEIGDFSIIGNSIFFSGYFYSFHFSGNHEMGKASLVNGSIDELWNPNIKLGFRKIIAANNNIYYVEHVSGGFELRRFNLTSNQTDAGWVIGITGGNVTEFFIQDDNIYLFGNFYTVKVDDESYSRTRSAKIIISDKAVDENWNASINQPVYSASLSGNYIYIGGDFTGINNQEAFYIARIDKNSGTPDINWKPVVNQSVSNIYLDNNVAFVSGYFTSAGGHRIKHLARINNQTYNVDAGWNFNINNAVDCIIKDGVFLYFGGSFTLINGETRNRLAAIDINSKTLATHFAPSANGQVLTMVKGNNQSLFVGGSFSKVNNFDRNYIAKIDFTGNIDNQWNANIPDGSNTKIHVIKPTNTLNNLFIGGKFSSVNGVLRNNAAVINQSSAIVSGWNPNANNSVFAIQPTDNGVFIGGAFTKINNTDLLHLAKVDEFTGNVISDFAPVITTSGSSGSVNTICQQSDYIYVGAKSVLFDGKRGFAKLNITNGEKDSDWDIELTQNSHHIQSIACLNDNIILGGLFSALKVVSDEKKVINLGFLSKSGTTGNNNPYLEDRYQWVYPNPFDNILYFQQGSIVKHIFISNLAGQVVINTPIFEEAKLNTGHLKSGIYLVKLVLNNNETKVFKMIKN